MVIPISEEYALAVLAELDCNTFQQPHQPSMKHSWSEHMPQHCTAGDRKNVSSNAVAYIKLETGRFAHVL